MRILITGRRRRAQLGGRQIQAVRGQIERYSTRAPLCAERLPHGVSIRETSCTTVMLPSPLALNTFCVAGSNSPPSTPFPMGTLATDCPDSTFVNGQYLVGAGGEAAPMLSIQRQAARLLTFWQRPARFEHCGSSVDHCQLSGVLDVHKHVSTTIGTRDSGLPASAMVAATALVLASITVALLPRH